MSDTDDLDIAALREKATLADAAEARAKTLERELLFAKVGVDTKSTIGGMLLKTFDGTTEDELRAVAAEVGAIKVVEQAPAQHPDATMQQFREGVAAGQTPTIDPGPDPWDAGLAKFHADRRNGVPLETAQLHLAEGILQAGQKRDRRVLHDPVAWAKAGEEADRMAML